VAVDLNGQVDGLFHLAHQLIARVGVEQAGHVLDADRVRAEPGQFLGQLDEPVDGVDWADGVADGALHVAALALDHFHGVGHVADIVQGVENAKDLDAALDGTGDEFLHQVIGVVAIAHDVLPAQEHLEGGIGHLLLEGADPLPGILVQEPHGRVKGRAAPHLDGMVAHLVHLAGDGQHVRLAHAGRQKRLVRVAQGRFRDLDRSICHCCILLDSLGVSPYRNLTRRVA